MASATVTPPTNGQHALVGTLVFIGLVVAAVGSLGAPLVRTVAVNDHVSLAAAQWTLTISLLGGAVSTPVLGRLGDGPRRRAAIITTLGGVLLGSILTTLPLRLAGLVAGRGFQGMGLGLTALVIGVARDAFRGTHSQSVIGLLSVTSVAVVASGIRWPGSPPTSGDCVAPTWRAASSWPPR
jgi:MFS family permease